LTGNKQRITQELSKVIEGGKEAARRLRLAVKANIGTDNEQLVQFNVAPRRARGPKKPKVKPPPVDTPPPVGTRRSRSRHSGGPDQDRCLEHGPHFTHLPSYSRRRVIPGALFLGWGFILTKQGASDSLWSWTLADFRERTAAGSPTPGGGAVSAVCATLGVGLVVMGLEVTLREPRRRSEPPSTPCCKMGRDLLERQSAHADRDLKVFDAYMRARSLPQEGEAEKAVRREKMQRALVAATEVPLAAARDVVAAIDLSRQVSRSAKPQVLGDVAAGADLLSEASQACCEASTPTCPGLRADPCGRV